MAAKRMFKCSLMTSDQFRGLSYAAQSLYHQINYAADDEGYCNCVNSIMKGIRVKKSALTELVQSGFIIQFESGVVVVTHWLLNNTLQKDRMTPTLCINESRQLMTDTNKIYFLKPSESKYIGTKNDSILETQFSIDESKRSLEKISEGKESQDLEELYPVGKHKNVFLTQTQAEEFLGDTRPIEFLSDYMHDNNVEVSDHYGALKTWVTGECSKKYSSRNGGKQS